MTSLWSFTVWGFDLIRQLPIGKAIVQYAVVEVDYFTKWIEAKALSTITMHKIYDFVYRSIICRYVISHKIVSKNWTQFDSVEFQKFCNDLSIKKSFSLVARPHTNKQVEVANKTLKHNLKIKFEGYKGMWPEQLPEVLHAYKMTTHTPIGESSFFLAYRFEAMIPIKIGVGSLRRDTFEHNQNHELQRIELELLGRKKV